MVKQANIRRRKRRFTGNRFSSFTNIQHHPEEEVTEQSFDNMDIDVTFVDSAVVSSCTELTREIQVEHIQEVTEITSISSMGNNT